MSVYLVLKYAEGENVFDFVIKDVLYSQEDAERAAYSNVVIGPLPEVIVP